MLYVHWTMSFGDHKDIADSVSDLQRFLDTLDIHLCQHTKMSDLRIAAKIYTLCNLSRPAQDPVDTYKEAHRGRIAKGCKRCQTTFERFKEGSVCHVLAKRYLGPGASVYEKRWLAERGEKKH